MQRLLFALLAAGAASMAVYGHGALADPLPEQRFNPLLGEGDVAEDTATPYLHNRIESEGATWVTSDPDLNAALRDEQMVRFVEDGAPPPLVLPP